MHLFSKAILVGSPMQLRKIVRGNFENNYYYHDGESGKHGHFVFVFSPNPAALDIIPHIFACQEKVKNSVMKVVHKMDISFFP